MSEINANANDTLERVAKTQNFNNANDMLEQISEGLKSNNGVDVASAKNAARTVLTTLTPLLFDQYVRELKYSNFYGDFVKQFFFKVVETGNGTQVINQLPVGPTNTTTPLNLSQWTPQQQSKKFVETQTINFFTNSSNPENQTFSSQGFCVELELTISETEYLAYFKNGNIEVFYQNLRKQIEETTILAIYDKIANLVTGTSFSPQKTITGTATNAFECWTKEIFPNIRQMCLPNVDYNYSPQSKCMEAPLFKDVRIIMSPLTWTNLKTNIMSQLFHVDYFKDGVLDEENIDVLGRKLTLGNGTEAITLATSNYIDDNTIIVYEKGELLKWIRQYQGTASQFFASNFTNYYHHYEVLALDFMPWAKCFKYTNSSLNVNPNGAN